MNTLKNYIKTKHPKLQNLYMDIKAKDFLILESVIIAIITGVFFSASIKGSYKHINSIDFVRNNSLTSTILIILGISIISIVIYIFEKSISKLLMLFTVYSYLIKCAFYIKDTDFTANSGNTITKGFFLLVLCFVSYVTFNYAKDDLYKVIKRIQLNSLALKICVALIGISIAGYISYVSILRYMSFSNATFDFGIFAQMYEYMVQKGTLDTTVERQFLLSHFAVHFSPVFYLTYPIYFVFRSPITIQVIEAFLIALPVIPIALLSKHFKLSNWMTVAICLFYALFPATIGGTFYDIHENSFLIFNILMLMFMSEKKNYPGMIIFSLIIAMIKEDAPMYIVFIGLYLLLSRRDRLNGLVLMVMGGALFMLTTGITDTYGVRVSNDRYADYFYQDDDGLMQVIVTSISNPSYFFGQMVKNYNNDYLDKLVYYMHFMVPIAPVLFMTKKNYSRYILLIPLLLYNLGTTYPYMHDIGFHYNFGPEAFIIYMIILNLQDTDKTEASNKIITAILCAGIFFSGIILDDADYFRKMYADNHEEYFKITDALTHVPEGSSVSASPYLIPHLSDHLILYEHQIYKDIHHKTPDVDYYVIDMRGSDFSCFSEDIESGGYELYYEEPSFIAIYSRID